MCYFASVLLVFKFHIVNSSIFSHLPSEASKSNLFLSLTVQFRFFLRVFFWNQVIFCIASTSATYGSAALDAGIYWLSFTFHS